MRDVETFIERAAALTVQEAMSKVMDEVRAVEKKQRNEQQNFTFRGIDAVVNAVGPALRKHNVVVLPKLQSIDYMPYQTSRGTSMMSCRVIVTYRFVGPGGDTLDATVAGESSDSGDKSTPKAMSVAFRTALLQALALPTDDPDPDAQNPELGESTAARAATVTRPSEPRSSAQAAPQPASESGAASPGSSASGGADVEAPAGEVATTPAGASTNYLDADDQSNLIEKYGGKLNAINAYKAKFGQRITRMGDITYEMLAEMEGANA